MDQSKRPLLIGAVVLFTSLVTIFAFWSFEYFAVFKDNGLSSDKATILDAPQFRKQTDHIKTVDYKLEVFTTDLFVPWGLAFTSPERALVTERNGQVRIIEKGNLVVRPLHTLSDVNSQGESGLLGIALDPNYTQNRYVYLAYTYETGTELVMKVVRFVDMGNIIGGDRIIIDSIPANDIHSGGRIKFGPDGKLYITTGDAGHKQLVQVKSSLAGKILRINPNGTIPTDNPFPESAVYSLGHRNSQGIAWSADGEVMYSSEHGPTIVDGPAGGDEINVITAGGNYGWPVVSHEDNQNGLIAPSQLFTPAVAPGSALVYSADIFPQFKHNLFFGALKGEGIVRVIFSAEDPDKVIAYEQLKGINVGRVRDVVQGPDGYIYFTTSNRDGRGSPREKDDKIYRLVPK